MASPVSGSVVLTQPFKLDKGDSPVFDGSYFSTSGSNKGNSSSEIALCFPSL